MGSTLLVFIALMVVVLSSFIATYDKGDVAARRIDLAARAVFPATYFLSLVWFIFG